MAPCLHRQNLIPSSKIGNVATTLLLLGSAEQFPPNRIKYRFDRQRSWVVERSPAKIHQRKPLSHVWSTSTHPFDAARRLRFINFFYKYENNLGWTWVSQANPFLLLSDPMYLYPQPRGFWLQKKELVICFLKGLNDSYKAMRSQILTMFPLSPVSEAFSMVQQQECPPNGTITIDSTNIIVANTYNGWSQQNSWGGNQGRRNTNNSGNFN